MKGASYEKTYAGIDLHSNNSIIAILNDQDKVAAKNGHPMIYKQFLSIEPCGVTVWLGQSLNLLIIGIGWETPYKKLEVFEVFPDLIKSKSGCAVGFHYVQPPKTSMERLQIKIYGVG